MPNSEFQPPDRYNKLGEWKPLIYLGNTDALTEGISRATKDEEVQGALLYIRATGRPLIEFVVRTSLRLPAQPFTVGNYIHLWACPTVTGSTYANQNVIVYDGWTEVTSDDPAALRRAIDTVSHALHRIAFAFQASLAWRLKYMPSFHARGLHQPDPGEYATRKWVFNQIPEQQEAAILDAAIDWYNRGTSSSNPMTEFLCYYIALETVAIAVTDGVATFGLNVISPEKTALRQERTECIQALRDQLYDKDPVFFTTSAYFDCVVGLKRRLKAVIELVFGKDHPHVHLLFESSNGPSLTDIRSRIAHGSLALVRPADETLVRSRIHELSRIAHEFLLSILHRSLEATGEAGNAWPKRSSVEISISMADPRGILILNDSRSLPTSDWRIRPEWCD